MSLVYKYLVWAGAAAICTQVASITMANPQREIIRSVNYIARTRASGTVLFARVPKYAPLETTFYFKALAKKI